MSMHPGVSVRCVEPEDNPYHVHEHEVNSGTSILKISRCKARDFLSIMKFILDYRLYIFQKVKTLLGRG